CLLLFFILSRPPIPPLFPYTTLSRSDLDQPARARDDPLGQCWIVATGHQPAPSPPCDDTRHSGHDQGECGQHVYSFDRSVADERSEEHTSELQSLTNLVCRLLLEKKK